MWFRARLPARGAIIRGVNSCLKPVIREARRLFFFIRLWEAGDVVIALQDAYEKLPAELRAEIPLRRVWYLGPDE